jgi:hypothetical protein
MRATAFEVGFHAFCKYQPFDVSQSQEWKNGWIHAQALEQQILTTG